jgi:cyclic pyranopterin phosphate synthase
MQDPLPQAPLLYPFEETDEKLETMPLAARRALDLLGRKLSLQGWLSLGMDDRWRIVRAGANGTTSATPGGGQNQVDAEVLAIIEAARPAPGVLPPSSDPEPAAPPEELVRALGPACPLSAEAWRSVRPLDRYTLVKVASRPEKLARAYAFILGGQHEVVLSHVTPAGEARMVDVGAKPESLRRAVASARVRASRAAIGAVASGDIAKGDVLSAARIAGIMAAKKASELIPLCHPLRVTKALVELEPDVDRQEIRVRATVEAFDRTGVEMEAMVAASVASLTVYDMIKSADRWATIESVRLESKSGGKSGDLVRPAGEASRG